MIRKPYPTDLSDEQRARLAPSIPPAMPGGRRRTVNVREVVNAILYFVRTGCQWRNLPHDFPPWGTVHYYYRRWRLETGPGGRFTILCASRYAPKKRAVRLLRAPRSSTPKASRAPKRGASGLRRGQADQGSQAPYSRRHPGADPRGGSPCGGSPGSRWSEAAPRTAAGAVPSPEAHLGGRGLWGRVRGVGKDVFGVGSRDRQAPEGAKGVRGAPSALGSGTIGWLGRYRRLSKDYEERPASEEAIILIAMINLMVHRLEPD